MPKFTTAYSDYLQRLREITELQRLASRYSKISATASDKERASALCRAAVVLLSSHIEGYVEDLASLALDNIVSKGMKKDKLSGSFFYYFSKDIITAIKDTGDPLKISEKLRLLLNRDADIWEDSPNFSKPLPSERFVHGFANPKTEQIKSFFARFGYDQYTYDMKKLLKAEYVICANMVDQVVDQRNKIAHGDYVVTGTPKDVNDMVRLVTVFCRNTDRVVATWFKKHRCPIR